MLVSILLLPLLFPPAFPLDYSTLVNLNASCYPRDSCSAPRDLDDPSHHTCDCSALCTLHNTCCIDAPGLQVRGTKSRPMPSCRQVSPKNFYFMHGECRAIRDHPLARRCERDAKDWADPFGNVPVTNVGSHTTYKNVFCAICNGEDVRNLTMWQVSLDCTGLRDDMVLCHENKDFVLRNMVYIRDKAQWGIWLFVDADWVFRPLHLSSRVPDVARTSVHPCRSDVVSECHPEWPEDDRMWTLRERNERHRATRDLDGVLGSVRENYENWGRVADNPLVSENYRVRTTNAPVKFPSDDDDTFERRYQPKSMEVPLRFPNDDEGNLQTTEDFNDNSQTVKKWPEAASRISDRQSGTSESSEDRPGSDQTFSDDTFVSPDVQMRVIENSSKRRTEENPNHHSQTVQNWPGSTTRSPDKHLRTSKNPPTADNHDYRLRTTQNWSGSTTRSSDRQLRTTENPPTADNHDYRLRTTPNWLEDISRSSVKQLRTTKNPPGMQTVKDQSQTIQNSRDGRRFRTTERAFKIGTVDSFNERLPADFSTATSRFRTSSKSLTQENSSRPSRIPQDRPEFTSTSSNRRLRTTESPARHETRGNKSNNSRTVPSRPHLRSSNDRSSTTDNPAKLQTDYPKNDLASGGSRIASEPSNKQFRATENPADNQQDPVRADQTSRNASANPLSKMSLREACGYYMGVVHYPSASYRNVHCAICNFEKPGGLICDGREGIVFKGSILNFGMLMDIDLRDGTNVGRVEGAVGCEGESQVFDPFSKKCRTMECGLPGYVLKEGKCVLLE